MTDSHSSLPTTACLALLLAASFCLGFQQLVLAQASEPPPRPPRMENPLEYYRAPSTMKGKMVVLPIGATFEGRIDQTISSTHSHAGQKFLITVDSPVMLNGSDVIIPAGSQVIGEVAEAMPASHVPKQFYQDKRFIHGKLRVQINGLRTPDGITYPMVAGLTGEVVKDSRYGNKTPLGTSIAYSGSAGSFETVNPNRATDNWRNSHYMHNDGRPHVMSKKDLLSDPVLGVGEDGFHEERGQIRSLVLDHRDYYIYKGSPMMIRVTAPFKIGMSAPTMGVGVGRVSDTPVDDTLPPPMKSQAPPYQPNNGFSGGYSPPAMPVQPTPRPQQAAPPMDSF